MKKYTLVISFITLTSLLISAKSIVSSDGNDAIAALEQAIRPAIPFKSYISGLGIVEPSSENISIGTPINRIVSQVLVKVGQEVDKGAPLFRLENRDLVADLKVQQTAYEIAQAKLKRLESMPRQEDLITAETAFKSAEIENAHAKSLYEITQGLKDPRAISQEEINRRNYNYKLAEIKLQQTAADLEKVKLGTWGPDLDIARLEVQQAKVNVERAQTELQRTIIRSPIAGQILQIRIHEGEYTPVDSSRTPLMIVGDVNQKHLQVSINQFDAPQFNPKAPAVAFLRGNASISYPLKFISLEPYLTTKQNVTSELTEKVDTRVLRVTYLIEENSKDIFVGQQMDVFIDARNGN